MRRLVQLSSLFLAAALTLGGAAHADGGWSRPDAGPARWLAAGDVLALTSARIDGVLHRALVTERDGQPALVLETFDAPRRRERPTTQTFVETFRLHDRVLAFADVAVDLGDLAFRHRTLTFETWLRDRDEPLRCALELGALEARCDGAALPPRPHPGRPPVSWAAVPSVIQACTDGLYGNESELACLERVKRFAFDPTPIIAACDTHAYGDDGTLACLASVADARVEPTATIAACDAATYGQDAFLQCLAAAAPFRYPPAATIEACDHAMYGDAATVQCVGVASRYASDASATIAACDAAMYGDDAVLACVQRGGAY